MTSELPSESALKQLAEALSNLLVREIFATPQCFLAHLDGFNKASFLCEVSADRLLRERIRVAAPLGSQFGKVVLLFRRQMYFHNRSVGAPGSSVNRPAILAC